MEKEKLALIKEIRKESGYPLKFITKAVKETSTKEEALILTKQLAVKDVLGE